MRGDRVLNGDNRAANMYSVELISTVPIGYVMEPNTSQAEPEPLNFIKVNEKQRAGWARPKNALHGIEIDVKEGVIQQNPRSRASCSGPCSV